LTAGGSTPSNPPCEAIEQHRRDPQCPPVVVEPVRIRGAMARLID